MSLKTTTSQVVSADNRRLLAKVAASQGNWSSNVQLPYVWLRKLQRALTACEDLACSELWA